MKVPVEESYRETGKGPVPTKWLDTNKGDSVHPNIRSRFVAREIAHERDTAMFAASRAAGSKQVALIIGGDRRCGIQ